MPRKTNESTKNEKVNEVKKKGSKKATTAKVSEKKSATKKVAKTTSKKVTTKATGSKTTAKKTTTKATESKTAAKKTATKTTESKTTAKKATAKTATKTSKKNAAKKATKSATKKKKASVPTKTRKTAQDKAPILEYYDLPYRYNQTVVKLLAQTPKTLFIYWDISDEDRKKYEETYGKDFFNTTKPVLIIRNVTMNYSFEVDINDFANSWYLHVNDADSEYQIELGRRPLVYNEKIKDNYVYISSSNKLESPNDHILFDKNQNMIYFRNVKNNFVKGKNVASLSFIRNMGKIYNVFDLYKKIYKEENLDEFVNPSSSNFKI